MYEDCAAAAKLMENNNDIFAYNVYIAITR